MVTDPGKSPVTVPNGDTGAAAPELVPHVPPPTSSARVIASPTHTWLGPVIGNGGIVMFTIWNTVQPNLVVYIMAVAPDATPVTTPEVEFIVAAPVIVLLHVPPGVASASVIVRNLHTVVGPVIGAGSGFTVTTLVAAQPVLV